MKYILVKEGEYRPNAFSDLVETVNQQDDHEQVGFYGRTDYKMRLVRNMSTHSPEMPLAIAHYMLDPTATIQDLNIFRPINTELMVSSLDTYDYVLFGVVTTTHLVKEYGMVQQARYIGRTTEGKLIDLESGQLLNPDNTKVTFLTCYFGMVHVKGLQVYYLILDPRIITASSGFDYDHKESDTFFKLINDHDGTMSLNLFNPQVSGATQFGNTLLMNDYEVLFDFFGGHSVLHKENRAEIWEKISYDTDSDCTVWIDDDGIVHLSPFGTFGYVVFKFNCGTFFEKCQPAERPEFKYLIVRP